MGFFSWNCKACGHPALSSGATDKGINDWMTDVVILQKSGSYTEGQYDGYGRAGDWDYSEQSAEPCLYHKACWEHAGMPGYTGPSKYSVDQGWFFDDGDHDMRDPRVEHDPSNLEKLVAWRDGYKRGLRFLRLDEEADEGTYLALWRAQVDEARPMTVAQRKARYGYDPCEFLD